VEKHLKKAVHRGGYFLGLLLVCLLVLYFLSGIYAVSPDEMGVHQRFGKTISDRVPPGIHYHLPWPIDRIYRIPVHQVQRIQITDFGSQLIVAAEKQRRFPLDRGPSFPRGYSLTGDNNLVNLDCILQYTVTDPARYLFEFRENHSERLLYDAGCSTIIHCLTELPVDAILTFGKQSIEQRIKSSLQEIMDDVESGLAITFVELREVRAPSKVKKYFDDVLNAKQDKTKSINLAESYRNEEIPAAKARASRLIEDSEAYKNQVVTEAQGDRGRFLDRLSEYSKSKDITRRRLLFDTMRGVLVNVKKAYVVAPSEGEPIDLKVLQK